MFKDVYKSAFNDINADPQLISKILENAQPRRTTFVYRYAFSACAAVIALAILIPSIFCDHDTTKTVMMNPHSKTEKSVEAGIPAAEIAPKASFSTNENISPSSSGAVVSDMAEPLQKPEVPAVNDAISTVPVPVNPSSDFRENETVVPETSDSAEQSSVFATNETAKTDISAHSTANPSVQENVQAASEPGSLKEVTEAVNQKNEAEAVKEPEKNPVMLSINKIEPVYLTDHAFSTYADSPNAGGGSGAVSRSLNSPDNAVSMGFAAPEIDSSETVSMSANDYFKHIGFNPEKLVLPDGLTADYSSETIIQIKKQADAIQSDTATFTFSGDSFVSVTTSSESEKISSLISNDEYTKTQIGDNSIVVTYDGSSYTGYFLTPEGSAIEITSVDLSEEEFTKLIISAVE